VGNRSSASPPSTPYDLDRCYDGSLTPEQLYQLVTVLLRLLEAERRLRRAAARHHEEIA
jgi:hypothetical protein